jgi:hypothetical protein
VTTASLFVTAYDPQEISMSDGIFKARDENIRPVHFVRFTKQFTANGPERTRLRTVIIAQAEHLKELVDGILDHPSVATSGERLRDLTVPWDDVEMVEAAGVETPRGTENTQVTDFYVAAEVIESIKWRTFTKRLYV